MVDDLIEHREQRLDEARCPECGARVDVQNMQPSWCWTCRSSNCMASGMWFGSKRAAEDNLLQRYYEYSDELLSNYE